MRKIVTGAFVSLDGVMQAPGGPEEDPTGGFEYGGWVAPYWDDAIGAAMDETFAAPFDLLLGRRTYDIFAAHWPYVQPTRGERLRQAEQRHRADVQPDHQVRGDAFARHADLAEQPARSGGTSWRAVRELKKADGPVLLTQGSSELIQTLLAARPDRRAPAARLPAGARPRKAPVRRRHDRRPPSG